MKQRGTLRGMMAAGNPSIGIERRTARVTTDQ
jgi:hypothetical protein